MNMQQYEERRAKLAHAVEALRQDLTALAQSRKGVIQEYVNLDHQSKRGKFDGLVWDASSLCVHASWNYYEGRSQVEFPNELLWSDEPLQALKAKRAEAIKAREEERRQRDIAERDRLLSEYPLD